MPPGTLENSTYKVVEKKLEFQKKADCIINCTDADTAGHYQGRYEKHHSWSERSDPLELVGTGEQAAGVSSPHALSFFFLFTDFILRTVSDPQKNSEEPMQLHGRW